jgi:hypothetical protein
MKNFISRWQVIPHGNCRDAAQSCRVIDEHKPITPRNDNIMREFVLNDDFRDNGRNKSPARIRKRPSHHIPQIFLRRQFSRDACDSSGRKIGVVQDVHWCISELASNVGVDAAARGQSTTKDSENMNSKQSPLASNELFDRRESLK